MTTPRHEPQPSHPGDSNSAPGGDSLWGRAYRTLGPLAGGLILDTADLATFLPVGFVLGPIVGGLIGWWLSTFHGFGLGMRLLIACASGVYCTLPGTEFLPLATLIAACARWRGTPRRAE